MSTGRSNALDALPHASILAYFRRPRPARRRSRYYQRPPPLHRQQASNRASLLPRISEVASEGADASEDEEARLGFWGEETMDSNAGCKDDDTEDKESEESHCWGLDTILTFILYALLVFLLVLNMDLVLSRSGISTGIVDWGAYGSPQHATETQLHFCLTTPNRAAPGPQVWRFMGKGSLEECPTQSVMLEAGPTEARKMLSGDEILREDGDGQERAEVEAKFIDSTSSARSYARRYRELGDDLAEEGTLGKLL